MKKTLLATSIALTLGIITPSANAAFTPLAAGDYTMNITGGCFWYSDCRAENTAAFVDNTANQASVTVGASPYGPIPTTRPIGSAIGSGISGDGLMGVIDFAIDTSGNMTINSYNQDSYLNTVGGTFYFDAFGSTGTSAMTGNIGLDGAMTFKPIGREAMYAAFATGIGVQAFNRDSLSGFYDTFTSGTSTNRDKGPLDPSFTVTGTALSDNDLGGWVGTLVSAGNMNGSDFPGFNEVLYSEVWDITITASAVPVPAAAWLFSSGLLGLISVSQRRQKS